MCVHFELKVMITTTYSPVVEKSVYVVDFEGRSLYGNIFFMIQEVMYHYNSVNAIFEHNPKEMDWPSWFEFNDVVDNYLSFVENLKNNKNALNYVIGTLVIGCDLDGEIAIPKKKYLSMLFELFNVFISNETYDDMMNKVSLQENKEKPKFEKQPICDVYAKYMKDNNFALEDMFDMF